MKENVNGCFFLNTVGDFNFSLSLLLSLLLS